MMKEILSKDIMSFIHRTFCHLNQNKKFSSNWHIELIAEYLIAINQGKIKRLVINIPPRCLKSLSVSISFPAWIMQENPSSKIILTTYSQILSSRNLSDIYSVIDSCWYKTYFPNVRTKKQKNRLITSKNGFIYSTSTGGTLTGEGGDILIIDDPHNPTYIYSAKSRSKVIGWYEQTLYSRLNDIKSGSIILIMQRLHYEDLSGYLESKDGWHVLKIPVIADKNYSYRIGKKNFLFEKGQVIDDERFCNKSILKIKNNIGSINFESQYMQAPSIKTGFLSKDLLQFEENLDKKKYEFIIQSWDTGIKTGSSANFSVCTVWGVIKDQFYLIEIFKDRLSYPSLKSKIIDFYYKYMPKKLLIEDKGSGQSLIQDLRNTELSIVPVVPKLDKATRFNMNLDVFLEKRIFISDKMECQVQEVIDFPFSKNDDLIDSISQFLTYIKASKKDLSSRNLIRFF